MKEKNEDIILERWEKRKDKIRNAKPKYIFAYMITIERFRHKLGRAGNWLAIDSCTYKTKGRKKEMTERQKEPYKSTHLNVFAKNVHCLSVIVRANFS